MQRVLITGIGGFTGAYLAAELAASGWEVWGMGTHSSSAEARYCCVDLAEGAGLASALERIRPDAVVHLAAVSFVGHGDANAFYRVNLIGTRNLLSALAHCARRPSCVLLISSANVYGSASEGKLAESTPPHPANDYAVSKLSMEFMARLWREHLPLVIARPFNYTGVGQRKSFLVAKIADHFRRRADEIELGNLDVWRDFSDVRAVALAYRRLLEVRPVGETVNICSGRTYSLREIVSLAETITGHSIRIRVNPELVRSSEVRSQCGDPAKLQALIGPWQSPPLQETLRWMLEERDA